MSYNQTKRKAFKQSSFACSARKVTIQPPFAYKILDSPHGTIIGKRPDIPSLELVPAVFNDDDVAEFVCDQLKDKVSEPTIVSMTKKEYNLWLWSQIPNGEINEDVFEQLARDSSTTQFFSASEAIEYAEKKGGVVLTRIYDPTDGPDGSNYYRKDAFVKDVNTNLNANSWFVISILSRMPK